jgi:hypothetical protein
LSPPLVCAVFDGLRSSAHSTSLCFPVGVRGRGSERLPKSSIPSDLLQEATLDWASPRNEHRRLGHEAADRRSAYPRLFRVAISRDHFREARKCLHRVWALRGERVRQQIEALGQRRAASKGVGRPEKRRISCLSPIRSRQVSDPLVRSSIQAAPKLALISE